MKPEKELKKKLKEIAADVYRVRELSAQLGKGNKTRKLCHKLLHYQVGQDKPILASGNATSLEKEIDAAEPPPFNYLAFKLPNGKWRYVSKRSIK